MAAMANNTEQNFSCSVRYRLGPLCGWRRTRQGRKVQAMDTTLTRTEMTALPGSQRRCLDLPAAAPAQQLRLRANRRLLVQVSRGCLWLTRDGRPEDIVLQHGQEMQLREAGTYRLSAFGPAETQVLVWSPD
jgi:hypothetical protein